MISDAIISMLKSCWQITGLVEQRIYKMNPPPGFTYPAIAAHIVVDTPTYAWKGPTQHRSALLQIDVYALNPTNCAAVLAAVNGIVENYEGWLDDASFVQGSFVERVIELPKLPSAKGESYHSLLQVRFEYQTNPTEPQGS